MYNCYIILIWYTIKRHVARFETIPSFYILRTQIAHLFRLRFRLRSIQPHSPPPSHTPAAARYALPGRGGRTEHEVGIRVALAALRPPGALRGVFAVIRAARFVALWVEIGLFVDPLRGGPLRAFDHGAPGVQRGVLELAF